jgi:hypothetical protein
MSKSAKFGKETQGILGVQKLWKNYLEEVNLGLENSMTCKGLVLGLFCI